MPTYSYSCPNGHTFDLFERKISDKLKTKCPTCGKMATRQISAGAFHLKGSGFYATDYKSGKPDAGKAEADKAEGGTAEGGKGEGGKGEGGKGETAKSDKPEAKTETKSEPKSKPAKDAE
ncbi:MAG: zinc ribbon domain-containing protein [Gemmatimonadales bacterium]